MGVGVGEVSSFGVGLDVGLAVGVGVNASYHHPFGESYSNANWEGDGTINLIYLFGGDERK